ncbi:Crp/Fnr family transcriptional regulator [Vampirovibrio sp.]|uniref:Crp/Fnr family transcriptional regulator n=1 Tax=Vampirovibrio sp. TaxID=2717857 RepID=UPI003592E935
MALSLENKSDLIPRFRKIPLFESLSDQALQEIAGYFYEANYDKETVIFYERDLPGDTGSKIYFVLKGCVKLVKYSSDGESTIVRLSSVGEFFGVTGALTDKPMPYSAEALTDSTVIYLEKSNFVRLVERFPQIAIGMITALGQVLWFNYETHNQVVKKTDARVSKILLYHFKRDGFTETPDGKLLNIQLPHDYIASMTGIAYEESVRIISRLKKMYGCINYLRGGKIVITNLEQLSEIAQTEDAFFY